MTRHRLMIAAAACGALAAGAAPAMASLYVKIDAIYCQSQQELGADEIYMVQDGVRTHFGNFYQGNMKSLNIAKIVPSFTTIALWEDDGDHWWDRDDSLGQQVVSTVNGGGSGGWLYYSRSGSCCTPSTIYQLHLWGACNPGVQPWCPTSL